MILQRLNPADNFTLVLDREIRASGLPGNYCALVVELEGIPGHAEIRQRCVSFANRFPLAVARLSRQGRQYAWVAGEDRSVPFYVHASDSDRNSPAHQRLLEVINKQESLSASAPFEIHLIEADNRSQLVLRWFHPAADAKGVELFLHYLVNDVPPASSPQQSPVELLQNRWGLLKKIRMASRAVRNIRQLDRHSSVLPAEDSQENGSLSLKLVNYSDAETAQIMAQARKHTGMTGTTLYLIGCMMRAMEFTTADSAGDAYCVPYATNLRRRKALAPVFGNQVGFLFAQADRDMVRSRERLFAHLRDQSMESVRQGLDHAMLPLMQAGSWLSAEKFGRIIRKMPDNRERSSFWFSYTGDMEPEPETIAGCPVNGVFQISPVTSPPGLGLLASRYRGRLVLSYNTVSNRIGDDWRDRLAQAMTKELLGGDGAPA